jgi:hypothetical protein
MVKSASRDERTRNWTFVAYPDSAPEDWRDILDNLHVQWAESPLHDKDTNADGEIKKAHWHILLLFEGKKSYEQVQEITASINATIPQRCQSAKGMVRYFAHLDNPEKFQYPVSDIRGHGGIDVSEYLKPTASGRYELIREMMAYIRDNHIYEMQDLLDIAADTHFDDWFPLLCDNSAYIIGEYVKSARNRMNRGKTNE